jgi:hypothetical protein
MSTALSDDTAAKTPDEGVMEPETGTRHVTLSQKGPSAMLGRVVIVVGALLERYVLPRLIVTIRLIM